MTDVILAIKSALAAVGGMIGYFIGGVDGLMITLIVFIIVDYISGVLVAISKHKLNSEVGFKGICKKVLIIALVGVANLIDIHVIRSGAVARTAVIFFYAANEGISIIENATKLGLPVPAKLKKILNDMRKEGEGNDDNSISEHERPERG